MTKKPKKTKMLTIFRLETEIFRPENPEIKLKTNFELKKPKFGQI